VKYNDIKFKKKEFLNVLNVTGRDIMVNGLYVTIVKIPIISAQYVEIEQKNSKYGKFSLAMLNTRVH
jgi:hypothetical protein